MRILGIDPGTHRLGFGLIESDRGGLRAETFGCLEPDAAPASAAAGLDGLTAADRLVRLAADLETLLVHLRPDAVAVEELYFARNVTTGLRVAEARGVVLLVVRRALLPVAEYKPNLVKAAVSGYGLADKRQMGRMVQILLKLPKIPQPDDAADALAVAICHAAHTRAGERFKHERR